MRIAVAFAVLLIAALLMICANFRQPTTVLRESCCVVTGLCPVGRGRAPLPHVLVVMLVGVFVSMIVPVLLPENFPRQIFLAVDIHIDFGRRNSASHHPRNLQPRTDIERRDRVFQKLGGHPGIHQRAQKHVAADAGKTVEVGYAHDKNRSLAR